MSFIDELITYYQAVSNECIPGLSLDCVIFGFHDTRLKVLLLQWKGTNEWCLPGGFIYPAESVDDAAGRVLGERTGLNQLFLQQFHLFGDANRYDRKLSRHDHALCNNCGKLVDLELPIPAELLVEASARSKFKPESIELTLRGLCPECSK